MYLLTLVLAKRPYSKDSNRYSYPDLTKAIIILETAVRIVVISMQPCVAQKRNASSGETDNS